MLTKAHRSDGLSKLYILFIIIPRFAYGELDGKGYGKLYCVFHFLAKDLCGAVGAALVRFDDELVVNLQNEMGVYSLLPKAAAYVYHRYLDNVSGSALDRAVHRHALAEFFEHLILSRELGDISSSAVKR